MEYINLKITLSTLISILPNFLDVLSEILSKNYSTINKATDDPVPQ